MSDRIKWSQGNWEVFVKRRLAILAVGTAMAFGSTVGAASATYDTPQHCNNGVGNGADCRPGKAHFNNDDNPTVGFGVPGDPGSMKGGRGGVNAY
jgi:hypothetical protein